MKTVKILKDHLTFKKGDMVDVTDITAEKFVSKGIAEMPGQKKEEKAKVETKEDKTKVETKAKTTKAPK
jgi:predicted ribosome-associated RNA-binding protein Tma20